MATVTVNDPVLGDTLILDARQTDMCIQALADATRKSWWDWLLGLLGLRRPASATPRPARISPDLIIQVEDSGRRETWEVRGRFVVSRQGQTEAFQFYFALLLFEWLALQPVP